MRIRRHRNRSTQWTISLQTCFWIWPARRDLKARWTLIWTRSRWIWCRFHGCTTWSRRCHRSISVSRRICRSEGSSRCSLTLSGRRISWFSAAPSRVCICLMRCCWGAIVRLATFEGILKSSSRNWTSSPGIKKVRKKWNFFELIWSDHSQMRIFNLWKIEKHVFLL